MLRAIGWAFLGFFLASGAAAADLHRFSQSQPHMGVEFEVVLYARDQAEAETAFRLAFARIAELDQRLSDYSLESELSQLSARAPTAAPITVSDDLFRVLQASQALAMETGGAFDITVGPLTKLWRRARRQKEVPTAESLQAAREEPSVIAILFSMPTSTPLRCLRKGCASTSGELPKASRPMLLFRS
jgi:FAD:protein FMN transferase